MCDEPYMIIGLGNAYDFVIKNVNEPETYGTFQGDKKSIKEFIGKVNSIVKENDELKKDCTTLVYSNQEYRQENENLKKQLDYIQNSINEHIKHQKTGLGQKALRKIIEDYNEWMLGHKELKE